MILKNFKSMELNYIEKENRRQAVNHTLRYGTQQFDTQDHSSPEVHDTLDKCGDKSKDLYRNDKYRTF